MTTPQDYEKEDGYREDNGVEVCPHCDTDLGGQGGIHGPVFDSSGRRFDSLYDTDPSKGPYFCEDCIVELERNKKAQENHGLGEFA